MRIKPLLVLLFLIVLFIRLLFSLNNDFFSSDESYFNLRQIDNISRTGLFLSYDPLANKEFVFSPLFHYIFALFYKLWPNINFLKFINNLALSSCIFLFFAICKSLTKNDTASLIASTIFSFIPIFFMKTFNDLSQLSLFIPCGLYLILFLLEDNKNMIKIFLFCLILASFLSPLIIIFIFTVILFLIFLFIDDIKLENWHKELLYFSIFFVLWAQIIIYKRALFMHGGDVIWQNIPNSILNNFFSDISLFISIYEIGIIPIIIGTYIIYKYLLKEKDKSTYIIISFALAVTFILWFKLIEVRSGLLFLGIALSLLSAKGIRDILTYTNKTKKSKIISPIITMTILVTLLITSIVPVVLSARNISENDVRARELNAMLWLKNNSEKNSTILALPNYGFIINAVANRKTIISNDFILLKNSDELYNDIQRVFISLSAVEIMEILEKYNVDYIFISNNKPSNINEIIENDARKCLSVVFRSENAQIVKRIKSNKCRVKVIE